MKFPFLLLKTRNWNTHNLAILQGSLQKKTYLTQILSLKHKFIILLESKTDSYLILKSFPSKRSKRELDLEKKNLSKQFETFEEAIMEYHTVFHALIVVQRKRVSTKHATESRFFSSEMYTCTFFLNFNPP